MNNKKRKLVILSTIVFGMTVLNQSFAKINTVKGPVFNLTATSDYIITPDGGSYLMWGYGLNGGRMQYTGPVMDVNEGDTVTVNLTNELTVPASIVFPGQVNVSASGDSNGLLTKEADPGGGTAQYSFVAEHPGTYISQRDQSRTSD